MTSHQYVHPTHPDNDFVIGFHVGNFGRWVRLIFATYFLVFFTINPIIFSAEPITDFIAFATTTGVWIVAVAAIYMVVFYAIGELVLSKMNPWTGTVIFLGTPTILRTFDLVPTEVQAAIGIYISLSLILIFFMRYGGCEVVALPTLLTGKRYTMYCPYNAIDAVERGVTPGKDGGQAGRAMALVSLTITLFVGSWFIFVERSSIPSQFDIDWHIDKSWAYLLLIPVAHLAFRAFQAWQSAGTFRDRRFGKYGLGALILFGYVFVFTVGRVELFGENWSLFSLAWRSLMVSGGAYVLWEILMLATGRKKLGKTVPATAEERA